MTSLDIEKLDMVKSVLAFLNVCQRQWTYALVAMGKSFREKTNKLTVLQTY